MKKWLGTMCAFFLVYATQAQENLKLDVQGGFSNPLGDYKMPIGRAQGGYFTGVSLDYYFLERIMGFGIDARFTQHRHSPLDTLLVDNATLYSKYSTQDSRFRYMGVFVGPTFQSYIGNLGIELYVKGGVVNQQMPVHDRHLLFYIDSHPINEHVFSTGHPERSTAFGVVSGFRINYKVNNWLGIFMMGDYQDHFTGKGYEMQNLQPQFNFPASETPAGTAKIKMTNVGMGLKFMFGGGNRWDSLSEF